MAIVIEFGKPQSVLSRESQIGRLERKLKRADSSAEAAIRSQIAELRQSNEREMRALSDAAERQRSLIDSYSYLRGARLVEDNGG